MRDDDEDPELEREEADFRAGQGHDDPIPLYVIEDEGEAALTSVTNQFKADMNVLVEHSQGLRHRVLQLEDWVTHLWRLTPQVHSPSCPKCKSIHHFVGQQHGPPDPEPEVRS